MAAFSTLILGCSEGAPKHPLADQTAPAASNSTEQDSEASHGVGDRVAEQPSQPETAIHSATDRAVSSDSPALASAKKQSVTQAEVENELLIEPQDKKAQAETVAATPAAVPALANQGTQAFRPADATQAAQKLDLRRMKPIAAEQVYKQNLSELDYMCRLNMQEAAKRHLEVLQDQGWEPVELQPASESTGRYLLRNEDLFLSLFLNESGAEAVGVYIRHLGNVDARNLPVPTQVDPQSMSSPSAAYYYTDLSTEDVTKYCREQMALQGWLEFKDSAMPSELPLETGNDRVVAFVQNGVTCYLSVSAPSVYTNNRGSVYYSLTGLIADGVGVPSEATQIRLDRSNGSASFVVPKNISKAQLDFKRGFDQGSWQSESALESLNAEKARTVMCTESGPIVLGEFREEGFATTHVRVKAFEGSELSEMMAAQAKAGVKSSVAEEGAVMSLPARKNTAIASENAGKSEKPEIGGKLAVDQFPLPKGAKVLSRSEPMLIVSDLDFDSVARFYAQTLPKHGFRREVQQEHQGEDGTQVLVFQRGNRPIAIMVREPTPGMPSIYVMGDAIEFESEQDVADLASSLLAEANLGQGEESGLSSGLLGSFADLSNEVADLAAMEDSTLVDQAEGESQDQEGVVRDSKLADRANNVAKCDATLGATRLTMKHAVAYQKREYGELNTIVLFTDKELPRDKLLLQLAQKGELSLFDLGGRTPQYIEVRWSETTQSCSFYVGGASVSGIGDELEVAVEIEHGWVHGKMDMKKPYEAFEDEFDFSATLDIATLNPDQLSPEMKEQANRPLHKKDGVLLPKDFEEVSRVGTQYSSTAEAIAEESQVGDVLDLYRTEMPKLGWHAKKTATNNSKQVAFANDEALMLVSAKQVGRGVELTVVRKDEAAARADNLLPQAGKGKLVIANATEKNVAFEIGKKSYEVKAGKGADDPKDALNWDVKQGTYKIIFKVSGQPQQPVSVTVEAGATWGVIILPDGEPMVDQLF